MRRKYTSRGGGIRERALLVLLAVAVLVVMGLAGASDCETRYGHATPTDVAYLQSIGEVAR